MNIVPATYGFEIEGTFAERLLRKLTKKVDNNIVLDGKSDSSVSSTTMREPSTPFEEITAGVFSNLDTMLEVLKEFTEDNGYLYNNTCGLHVHMGVKLPKHKRAIMSHALMQKLHSFSLENLCACNVDRIENHAGFCREYGSVKRTRDDLNYGEKYRIMRNHTELNTFEFRLFSPCEHMVENVKAIFDMIASEVLAPKPLSRNAILGSKDQKLDIKLEVPKRKTLDLNGKNDYQLSRHNATDWTGNMEIAFRVDGTGRVRTV